jgi:hypothetical protein
MDSHETKKEIPKNCANCCYGMHFNRISNILCGIHAVNFTPISLCDRHKTDQERFSEIQEKILSKLN